MELALVGTDPEVFVAEHGKIISAIGLVGGTKEVPSPVNKGALQEDNVLAEFNIDPAHSEEEFIVNINEVLTALQGRIGEGREIVVQSSHTFTKKELDHPQAQVFGCDPDFNAWTKSINPPPPQGGLLRTAGGHVHVGYPDPVSNKSYALVRLCDYLLGLPSVILDTDHTRREMYGAAGACRVKVYGFEYRTLSNFWLQHEEYTRWVYQVASTIHSRIEELFNFQEILDGDTLQTIINTGDVASATKYCDLLNIQYPKV